MTLMQRPIDDGSIQAAVMMSWISACARGVYMAYVFAIPS